MPYSMEYTMTLIKIASDEDSVSIFARLLAHKWERGDAINTQKLQDKKGTLVCALRMHNCKLHGLANLNC